MRSYPKASSHATAPRWVVLIGAPGAARVWNRFSDRAEAQRQARLLLRHGMHAQVVERTDGST
jgi:hypothetical protein